MLELIKTILIGTTDKFELYADNSHSSKVKRVIRYAFRNPDHEPGKAQWVYSEDVDISEFIKYENDPLARFTDNKKDNDIENIIKYCKQLCNY